MANEADPLVQHLRFARAMWAVFMATVPTAAGAMWLLPRLRSHAASPAMITLIALAGCAWVTLTADRDARARLARSRRAFAAHGDLDRLLRDHRTVLLVVLLRLEVIVACSLVVAVWGSGPWIAIWFALLGGGLIGLAWPTERKLRLLMGRARELRGDQ
jgi:hypothetical protein